MSARPSNAEDPRLERLYDYTKFHIGIYLLAAGAMVTILGSERAHALLGELFSPSLAARAILGAAILAMAISGLAGGVIASSCTTAKTFGEVWDRRIGPWRWWPHMLGRNWAALEHKSFWTSLILFVAAALA